MRVDPVLECGPLIASLRGYWDPERIGEPGTAGSPGAGTPVTRDVALNLARKAGQALRVRACGWASSVGLRRGGDHCGMLSEGQGRAGDGVCTGLLVDPRGKEEIEGAGNVPACARCLIDLLRRVDGTYHRDYEGKR